MIPKRVIHCYGLVQAISRYRFKRQIFFRDAQENMLATRAQNPGILQPATAIPALKLYQRTAAGNVRSKTKVGLPENENPAGRRRRPFQY